jgi:ribosomal-protein-alanine N-acetyltransferase
LLDYIFIHLPKIETNRIILRKLLYSDKHDILAYAKNPEVSKYLLWDAHQSEIDTIEFLNIIYSAYNKNNAAPWGIELKSSNKIIGTAGFIAWNKKIHEAEIGYALSQEYWNQGIISEAINEIVKFGFDILKLEKITARCKAQNIASYKVLEKSGFLYDSSVNEQMIIKGKLEKLQFYYLNQKK